MEILTGPHLLPAVAYGAAGARFSLWLMTYTVSGPRPGAAPAYTQLFQTLHQLPGRGVDCRLLHPAGSPGVAPPHAVETLGALTRAGWKIRQYSAAKTMHAKLFLIDSTRAFIGSANLSEAGLSANVEILAHSTDKAAAAQLRTFFLDHWKRAE